jgi:hypothetical protein
MATTKKTASAAPAKKAAAKTVKPATKKMAAPKPRSDYKPGARVKVTRRSRSEGEKEFKGFVTSVKATPTGPFIGINIGTKQVPILIEARPAKVRGF